MATFPGAKVKRPARNKLGRGQSTPRSPATATITNSTANVHIAFDVPVIVGDRIDLGIVGPAFVSQTQTDPTHVEQVYNATVASLDWDLTANDPAIKTFQGGGVNGDSGTFP